MQNIKPDGVKVFLEGGNELDFVGLLSRVDGLHVFEYDAHYINQSDSIPLGPELPLTKRSYQSEQLFLPFIERLPPKGGLSYPDYCKAKGISVDESDLIVLVSSVGNRGPSSFIFEPYYKS